MSINRLRSSCRICMKNDPNLVNLSSVDIDLVELKIKLYTCVPSIHIDHKKFPRKICPLCIEDLRLAYKFRLQCLESTCNIMKIINESKLNKSSYNVNQTKTPNNVIANNRPENAEVVFKKPEAVVKETEKVFKKPESVIKNSEKVFKIPEVVVKDSEKVFKKPESVKKSDEIFKKPLTVLKKAEFKAKKSRKCETYIKMIDDTKLGANVKVCDVNKLQQYMVHSPEINLKKQESILKKSESSLNKPETILSPAMPDISEQPKIKQEIIEDGYFNFGNEEIIEAPDIGLTENDHDHTYFKRSAPDPSPEAQTLEDTNLEHPNLIDTNSVMVKGVPMEMEEEESEIKNITSESPLSAVIKLEMPEDEEENESVPTVKDSNLNENSSEKDLPEVKTDEDSDFEEIKFPYICSECDRGFTSTDKLAKHLKSHIAPKWKCCTCYRVFGSRVEMGRHYCPRSESHTFLLTCTICYKKFKTSQALANHKKIHSDRAFSCRCKLCGSVFSSIRKLEWHFKHGIHKGVHIARCKK